MSNTMDEEIASFLISEKIYEKVKWMSYDDKIGGLSGASFFRLQMSSTCVCFDLFVSSLRFLRFYVEISPPSKFY